MLKAVWYGEKKLEIIEADMPEIKDGEALLKVKLAGLCITDIHVIEGKFPHATPPVTFGHEICGEIVEMKGTPKHLKLGDRVVVETMVNCGECYYCISGHKNLCPNGGDIGFPPYEGAYAEYIAVPIKCLYKMPDNMADEEGAIFEGFICPAGNLLRLGVTPGDTVIVYGSGSAGMAFVKTAYLAGASKVIVVDVNDERLNLVKEYEPQVITINPAKDNLEEFIHSQTEGLGVHISIEAAGKKETVDNLTKYTRPNGKILLYGIPANTCKIDFPVTEIILKQLNIYGISGAHAGWKPMLDLRERGAYDLKLLASKEFKLTEINAAIDYVNHTKNAIKVVIRP